MLKIKPSVFWKLSGAALAVWFSGCAAAYRDYQGSCIPYLYCTPSPLPYVSYESCHCPTPGASLHLQQRGAPDPASPESDLPIAAPASAEHWTPVSRALQ
jgi:hypothetical protein